MGYLAGKADATIQCAKDASDTKIADQGFTIEKQDEYRKEEARYGDVVESVSVQSDTRMADTATSAAVGDGLAERLRVELDTVQRRFNSSAATCDTRVAQQRTSAEAQFGVLTDLYRKSEQRAGDLAKEAEGYRSAGLNCQQIYDGVRNKPAMPQ